MKKINKCHNKFFVYSVQRALFLDGKYKFSNKTADKNVLPLRSEYLDLPASGKKIFDYIWSHEKDEWVSIKNETIAKATCCSVITVIRYKRLFISNGWLSSYQINNTENKFEINKINKFTPCYFKLHISPCWFEDFETWKNIKCKKVKNKFT